MMFPANRRVPLELLCHAPSEVNARASRVNFRLTCMETRALRVGRVFHDHTRAIGRLILTVIPMGTDIFGIPIALLAAPSHVASHLPRHVGFRVSSHPSAFICRVTRFLAGFEIPVAAVVDEY